MSDPQVPPAREPLPAAPLEEPRRPAGAPAAPASLPAPSARPARPGEVHDRLTLFVVRALFFFIAGGIGLYSSFVFRTDPAVSIVAACGLALAVILGEVFFSRAPVRTLAGITFGLIIGVVMAAVLKPVIEVIVQAIAPASFVLGADYPHLLQFLQLITTTVFCYFGVTVLLQTKDDFKFIIPYVEFRRELKGRAPLILDTSALIDGRIQALLATGVLDGRVAVPRFVCDELQGIADAPERGKRERGRRGMDILHEICRAHGAEVLDRPLPPRGEVDAALLELVAQSGGRLVTTDFNLQKRARLQGIEVVNLNDLAAALKPQVVPGESLRVKLLRPGEDPGQAVGFLGDGTMVVVENSSRRIGQEVTVEVTSAIQTSAGKMIFGRARRPPEAARPPGGGGRPDRSPPPPASDDPHPRS